MPCATYRCFMENCQANGFKTSWEMLHHLQACHLFRFTCTCNVLEKSPTISKKSPDGMLGFGQRLHEKVKEILRSITGSCSSQKAPPSPMSYQADPQGLPCDAYPQYHTHSQHLSNTGSAYELLGSLPNGNLTNSSPCLASEPFSPPVELGPGEPGRSGTSSALTSPTCVSVSGFSKAASGGYPEDGFLFIEPGQCPRDSGVVDDNYNYTKQNQDSWLFNGLSASNPTHQLPFPSQPGFNGNRGPPLKVVTNCQEQQNLHTPSWVGEQTDSGGTSWFDDVEDNLETKDTLNMEDSPGFEVISSSSFGMDISSPMDFAPNPNLLEMFGKDIGVPKLQSFGHSSPLDSITPPSISEQSPGSDSAPKFRCHRCNFTPTGKPENFAAYLRKHEATHDKTRSYKCTRCTKTFTRRDNQRVHARKSHADEIGPDEF